MDEEKNNIVFVARDKDSEPLKEMLRITGDGFYIQGRKVPSTPEGDMEIYTAFKEFLQRDRELRDKKSAQ